MTRRAFSLALTVLALTLGGCTSAGDSGAEPVASQAVSLPASTTSAPPMSQPPGASGGQPASEAKPAPAGMYLTYENYRAKAEMLAGSSVVLFFHAAWCPDCRATDTALTSEGVPDGLVVVKVDYDTMSDLKKTYRVTQQHTFVQIDQAGQALSKWTGSRDGSAIQARIG